MTRKQAATSTALDHRPLWTTQDTATFLNLSAYTVAEMARKKQLPSLMIGGSRRYRPADIERYIDRASA